MLCALTIHGRSQKQLRTLCNSRMRSGKLFLKEALTSKRQRLLLDLAKDELLVAKQKIGGQIVFVEMEHGNEQLAKFYADNGFVLFGSRDDVEDGQPITYDQLFLFLK